MSLGTFTPAAPPPGQPLYRLSVDQYEKMVAAGILGKHDRMELIEGALVARMTKGTRHCVAADCTQQLLLAALPAGWFLRIEKPVRILSRDSVPEPDLAIVRGGPRDYLDAHPGPSDVGLVIEVSDSSLKADRALATTYVLGGIPVYWLLNLSDRQLEVYTRDESSPLIVSESESVALVLDGQAVARIAVAEMLPRA